MKWFRKAAEQGYAVAQYNLGEMYATGRGVLQDYVTAYAWANITQANGIKGALKFKSRLEKKMTADQIAEGKKLSREMLEKNPKLLRAPKDDREAVKRHRKAAEQGNAMAQLTLGVMYYKGEGVLKDYVTAYAWWNIAAANGNANAKKVKPILAKQMTADQIAKAEELVKEMLKKNPKLLGE